MSEGNGIETVRERLADVQRGFAELRQDVGKVYDLARANSQGLAIRGEIGKRCDEIHGRLGEQLGKLEARIERLESAKETVAWRIIAAVFAVAQAWLIWQVTH